MEQFLKALARRRLLFDGSMGALLASMGHSIDCPELLNIHAPEVIRDVHRQYLAAGCDVLSTNSFGASPRKLARLGLSAQAAALTEAAVVNARAAAEGCAWVALDIGPSGELLAPAGTLAQEEAIASFAVCARAGAEAGADLILLETMTDIAECRAACLAARDLKLPIAASFTFEANGRNLTGGTPECAALTLLAAGAHCVGVNCSLGPAQMLDLLAPMRRVAEAPILMQPNAGLPVPDGEGRAQYPFTPEMMAPAMEELLAAGAAAIGGCCGTTPAHIRAFARLLRADAPASAWDGVPRICSARRAVPLAEALAASPEVGEPDDLYDLAPQELAARLDIRGLRPEAAAALVLEAQIAAQIPLILRADDAEALAAALRAYAGVAAVIAPAHCAQAAKAYGALLA